MRVLVASPYLVPPVSNGAEARIASVCGHLQRVGHDVHLFVASLRAISGEPDPAWRAGTTVFDNSRRRSPRESGYLIDDWVNDELLDRWEATVARVRPHAILVNYVFYSALATRVDPSTLKILDTHDRLDRADLYRSHGLEPGFFYTSTAEQTRALKRFDVVLAIQDREADYFRASGADCCLVVGHHVPPSYGSVGRPSLRQVGLVAAYNKFNVHGLLGLLEAVSVRGVPPPWELHVAGNLLAGMRQRGELRRTPGWLVDRGFVPSVTDFYGGIDAAINPVVLGTGLKIKTVEALAAGVPVISTACGFDGLPAVDPFHQAPDAPALVRMLDELASSETGLVALANTSRHVHTEYNINLSKNLGVLDDLISSRPPDPARVVTARGTPLAQREGPRWTPIAAAQPVAPPLRVTHILNVFRAGIRSDLYSAIPKTVQSLLGARDFARGIADVYQVAVQSLDEPISGDTAGLEVASVDLATIADADPKAAVQGVRGHLPLLGAILEAGRNAEQEARGAEYGRLGVADGYIVFTNADIGLMPHFYQFVVQRLRDGVDALVINRRTVSKDSFASADLTPAYSEYGADHPGYDCFVFPERWLDDMSLGDVAVGVHLVGRVLLWNLMARARNLETVETDHLTFHAGDDNAGKIAERLPEVRFNTAQALRAMRGLQQQSEFFGLLQKQSDPRLLSLDFSPSMIREQGQVSGRRSLHPAVCKRPIFIHGLFRTGSSAFWERARESPDHVAFYEPLHEELAFIEAARIEMFRRRHHPRRRHNLKTSSWFFAEYEGILRESSPGVAGYRRVFAYDRYAYNGPQPDLESYLRGLLDGVPHGRASVLQFNRSALRMRWMTRRFGEAWHVYLLRDPRQQFLSYLLQAGEDEVPGFARNDLIIYGQNAHRHLFGALRRKLSPPPRMAHVDFRAYTETYADLNWVDRYRLFYYIWLQSYLEANGSGAFVVRSDRIDRDDCYRWGVQSMFNANALRMDLSNFRMSRHDIGRIPLSEAEMEEIERDTEGLIKTVYGGSRWTSIPANTLEQSPSEDLQVGLWI